MMFIAAMAFSACDDDDKNDNIKVPDAVSKALKDKYPAAMDIECIIRKSKFPQNPKRSVRFSGKRTKRSVQKRKARNTQKAETKVL